MNRVKKLVRMIALVAVLCALLAVSVFATETGSVWVSETSADGSTVAWIIADTTVTDGVITVTYDAAKLTYEGIELNETYVAMHAVNAEEAGVVAISWVAPGAYELDEADWLIKVNFSGTSETESTLDGTVTGAEITDAPAVDTTELEKAIELAESLKEGNYTKESWAALEEALAAAKAVLADPTATQEEVDAAAAALNAAINALVLTDKPTTGDNSNLMLPIAVAVICVVAIAAVAVVMLKTKKGRKA